jgi:hypothetical protein
MRPGGPKLAPRRSGHRCIETPADRLAKVTGKMHLWRFDFVEENSILSRAKRRNNFLFARLAPQINRK